MNKFNITIVSGFLSNINNTEQKTVEKYIEHGKKLIEIRLPKVIFIDKQIYKQYFSNLSDELTKFIEIEKKDLYFYEHIDKITNFKLNSTNPNKDTMEYMFVQNHKTEWVKQAIQLDYFKTSQYVWIDFGIYHVFKDNHILFKKCVYNLRYKRYNNIRFPGCWHPRNLRNINILHDISWYFAGGVFGGHKDKLLEFANLTKEKCLYLINNKKHIMWEVNIWHLVYIDTIDKDLIDWTPSDHTFRILLEYSFIKFIQLIQKFQKFQL
jgi:hypothetical protein